MSVLTMSFVVAGELLVLLEQGHRVGGVDDRVDRAALAGHAVVVGEAEPAAGEGQRRRAVHVLVRARARCSRRAASPVRRLAADRHVVVDVDGDAAEGVDQPAEAVEVDQHVVVDVQAERLADAELEEVGARVVGRAEDVGVRGRAVAVDGVEQALALVAGLEAVRVDLGQRAVRRGTAGSRGCAAG